MTQNPLKRKTEPSLPDWLSFLNLQNEEDPFQVKGLKLFPPDKKTPKVITGTHNQGNLKDIDREKQNLLKEISPVKPIRQKSTKNNNNEEEEEKEVELEAVKEDLLVVPWKVGILCILIPFFFIWALFVNKATVSEINAPIRYPPLPPPAPEPDIVTRTTSYNIKSTSTTTTTPIPKRIADIIKQELSPFPAPERDTTPIKTLHSLMSETRTEELSTFDFTLPSIEWKSKLVSWMNSMSKLEEAFEQASYKDCDHHWRWMLHRQCRLQRKPESFSPPTLVSTVSSNEPCLHPLSKKCREQTQLGATEKVTQPPLETTSKQPPTKSINTLLEAAFRTHTANAQKVREELRTRQQH